MNPPDLLPTRGTDAANDEGGPDPASPPPLEQPEDAHSALPRDDDDDPAADPTATVTIKSEHLENGDHDATDSDPDDISITTNNNNSREPTLRPDPPPSKKRRESEAELQDPESESALSQHNPNKKRKRGASPPWQFPIAAQSTLKSADGRRVSARHSNVGTPGLSGSDAERVDAAPSRGRSQSTTTATSRPPSPPWKKFEAQGPTSIYVDGQRKSGRANKELATAPKRVSPRSKKQVDKLGAEKNADTKPAASKIMGGSSRKSELEAEKSRKQINGLDRPSTSTASAQRIAELQAQIAALQPSRSFPTPQKSESPVTNGVKTSTGKSKAKVKREPSPALRRKLHRPSDASLESPERSKPTPRLKLKVAARRFIPPPHPQAKVPSPTLPPLLSVWQLLDDFELQERQAPSAENDRGPISLEKLAEDEEKYVIREATTRRKLLEAAEPGGALSKQNLSLFQDDHQLEPPQQFGHHDHLTAHALYLRALQIREKTSHRALAKKVAQEALEKWKLRNGPTEEDLLAEKNKIIDYVKKQIVADMKAKWELVEAHVKDMKRRAWEKEQERVRAEKLREKLEYSENLLAKQRGEAESDIDMDEDSTGDVEESDADSNEDSEENMDSSDESEDEAAMDEEAFAAYKAKWEAELEAERPSSRNAEPPDRQGEDADIDEETIHVEAASDQQAPEDESTGLVNTDATMDAAQDPDAMEIDDSATEKPRAQASGLSALLMDDGDADDHLSSDESTNMDSEGYDSDEDMSSTGDEANDNDNDDDDDDASDDPEQPPEIRNSLMALFSPNELLQHKDGGLPTPVTSVENGGDNDNPRPRSETRSESQADAGAASDEKVMVDHEDQPKEAPSTQQRTTPPGEENGEPDPVESEEIERASESSEPEFARTLVPVPTLLRGTLRSYQHAGLDWLASLYRNGTNGILADEMGLGKTIQTISLLAHLAEVHEVWETHLVIVPTSVILNWVTEFQKFLPGFRVLGYYGTASEREFKRKGWTNDPHHEDRTKRGYNVVITSYNVAAQDINAIRGQQWHYLILDEAHNIRNFNSQRWQLLIRLRTRARLLLTGTPLQNDLSEVWSLLTFLTAGDDDRSHGELEEFLGHWKDPVKEIFDQGVSKLTVNAQRVVDQLHISLRPFLLRRKKDEVEKDLPKKTESVVVCKLSKRQRQLYQDYMGLASTRDTLAKGSGVQAGAVLLSLRRVCNHPDLFDPRPIQTSFAMEYSPLEDYSVCEQLVRRMLGVQNATPAKLLVRNNTALRRSAMNRSRQLAVGSELKRQLEEVEASADADRDPDPSTFAGSRALQRLRVRERKLQQLRSCIQITESALDDEPLFSVDLREIVTVNRGKPYLFTPKLQPLLKSWQGHPQLGQRPLRFEHHSDWLISRDTQLQRDVSTLANYAEKMEEIIVRFAFVPPAATVPILDYAIPPKTQEVIRSSSLYPAEQDFAQEARVRTSIAFPDKRLLIYDAGKLQRLTYLLRDLQSRGSRSLIFTQMTGTLDVLERFLSLMNLPYLRLDGSTPVERRQLYSSEFNRPDSKYQCMILSSRAGGVGLNLTGASSVIFYDLDWNPQMDRQCMDRAHRIGQTKDVEVYKLVSEKTVEENILRRANQKSLLDQAVIQDGHFTTEYQSKRNVDEEDQDDEVDDAIGRLLGGDEQATTTALASVEDKEDVQAAAQAGKEDRTDDVDFGDRSSKGPSKANTPGPGAVEEEIDEVAEERKGHVDLYMIKHMEHLLHGWVYTPPPARLDKHGRDRSHRPKKRIR
ncbi:Putative helicase, P-loop containing nucleoside triphosphate hydrolase, SNF2-like domain superfamily [Septoria linicola]|uniref:DNA helicase n=1 Tax=Septoria linicola TaxID=215465 RepID=A0A9Q9EJ41_9PEZI|nr:Putative helicase, P-loop containing nucleoside triphosphate hydrolase, SNF2-like domain superfamily [Septoria linicola]